MHHTRRVSSATRSWALAEIPIPYLLESPHSVPVVVWLRVGGHYSMTKECDLVVSRNFFAQLVRRIAPSFLTSPFWRGGIKIQHLISETGLKRASSYKCDFRYKFSARIVFQTGSPKFPWRLVSRPAFEAQHWMAARRPVRQLGSATLLEPWWVTKSMSEAFSPQVMAVVFQD